MVVTATPTASTGEGDQRVFLRNVSWKQYEVLLAIRGECAVPRMTYLEGTLELMSPSRTHETIKKTLARMLEAYAMERRLVFEGFGSWTLRSAPGERGLEPDECYMLGSTDKDAPDLAIEVIWTSGGIDKLEVYRGLGVAEVWLWRADTIEVYRLTADGYDRATASALLPDLDLALLSRCLTEADSQTAAVRSFLDAIRG